MAGSLTDRLGRSRSLPAFLQWRWRLLDDHGLARRDHVGADGVVVRSLPTIFLTLHRHPRLHASPPGCPTGTTFARELSPPPARTIWPPAAFLDSPYGDFTRLRVGRQRQACTLA